MIEDRSAQILEDCVTAVRLGRKTAAECLSEYPGERETLARLLPLASALKPTDASMDPARKLQGRVALAEAIHRERPQPLWAWPRRVLRRAPLAVGTAALVVALTLGLVTSAAASEAQPGDLLYGVKTGLEGVRLVVAVSPEAKTRVHLEIAGTRLAEVELALTRGNARAAEMAAAAYASTIAVVTETISAPGAGSLTKKLREILEATAEREAMVLATASAAGSDTTQLTLQRARDQVERALEQLDPRIDPALPGGPPSQERASSPPSPDPRGAVAGAVSPSQTPRVSQQLSGRATATPRPTGTRAAPVAPTLENRTATPTATAESRPIRGFVPAPPTAESREAPTPTSVRPILPPQARARSDDENEEGPRLLPSPALRRDATPTLTALGDPTVLPALTPDRATATSTRTVGVSPPPLALAATASAEPSPTTAPPTPTATATRLPTATQTPTRSPTATATPMPTATAVATAERRGRGPDRSGEPVEAPLTASTPTAAPTETVVTAVPPTATLSAPPTPGLSARGDRQNRRDRHPKD